MSGNPVDDVFFWIWTWVKRHWGPSILAPWLLLAGMLFCTGSLWGPVVALSLGALSYYGLAKIEALEGAEKNNGTTKG